MMMKVSRINAGQVLALLFLLRNTTLTLGDWESKDKCTRDTTIVQRDKTIKKTNERDDERFVSGVGKYS